MAGGRPAKKKVPKGLFNVVIGIGALVVPDFLQASKEKTKRQVRQCCVTDNHRTSPVLRRVSIGVEADKWIKIYCLSVGGVVDVFLVK